MKFKSGLCVGAILILFLCVPRIYAGDNATITWGANYPKATKGQVAGLGDYTIAAGWTLDTISMTATPTLGGKPLTLDGGSGVSMCVNGGGVSGEWDNGNIGQPIIVPGLKPGVQYTVFPTIKIKNNCGATETYNGPPQNVTIPKQ